MKLIHEDPRVTIYQGNAADYADPRPIDLILTNPYGAMPHGLRDTPQLLHQWVHRKGELERWCGRHDLHLVALWNDGREAFWSTAMPAAPMVDLHDLRPEPGGWYPPELPRRLLAAYGREGGTLWDGFMGRGTVGRAALAAGMRYVGVEQLAVHVALALDYLDLPPVRLSPHD